MTQSYKTILVAVDGSKGAELALHKAIHVATTQPSTSDYRPCD